MGDDRRRFLVRIAAGGGIWAATGPYAWPQDRFAGPSQPIRFLLPALRFWAAGEGDAAIGAMPDMARAILARAGVPGHLEILPQLRLYEELRHPHGGGAVFALSDAQPPMPTLSGAVAGQPAVGRPYASLAWVVKLPLVVVARTGARLDTVADVRRLGPVATTRTAGGTVAQLMEGLGVPLTAVPSMESGLRMLLVGRINGLVGVEATLNRLIDHMGLAEVVGAHLRVGEMVGWLTCSANTAGTPVAAVLARAVEALRSEGVFQRIVRDLSGWGSGPGPPVREPTP